MAALIVEAICFGGAWAMLACLSGLCRDARSTRPSRRWLAKAHPSVAFLGSTYEYQDAVLRSPLRRLVAESGGKQKDRSFVPVAAHQPTA